MIPLLSILPHPTTKKTPLNIARGIKPSTTRRGPVIVPIIAKPIIKCERRCSATLSAVVCFSMMTGGALLESDTEFVVRISTACSEYQVHASVWTGACGTSPFGSGMLRMPATEQVIPSRKKSQ